MTRAALPFTPTTLAERWQCSRTTITRMIQRGELPKMDFPLVRISAETVASVESGELPIGQNGKVYVVAGGGLVKIGFTMDIMYRLRCLKAMSPVALIQVALVTGTRAQERELHKRFATQRAHGEWFRSEGTLAEWIDAGCPL